MTYSVKGMERIKIKGVEVGTMIFALEDDDGMVHHSEIPGSQLVPKLGTRLFRNTIVLGLMYMYMKAKAKGTCRWR